MTPQQHAQLFRELADTAEAQAMHLTNADAAWKVANLATRARQAAEEIEDQSSRALILSRRLRQLSTAVAEQQWDEFTMRIPPQPDRDADLVLDEASRMIARFGGGEIEGRKQTGPDLDDLIDQAWRLHETTGCQGERFMYDDNFDRAVRWVLARKAEAGEQ